MERRLEKCRNVITLGVRTNFDDYDDEAAELIRTSAKIYDPTVFYADMFDATWNVSTWTKVFWYLSRCSRRVCNPPANGTGLQTRRERCWETYGQVVKGQGWNLCLQKSGNQKTQRRHSKNLCGSI